MGPVRAIDRLESLRRAMLGVSVPPLGGGRVVLRAVRHSFGPALGRADDALVAEPHGEARRGLFRSGSPLRAVCPSSEFDPRSTVVHAGDAPEPLPWLVTVS